MSRLNLEAFKAQVDVNQTKELESLTGGILGACHSSEPWELFDSMWDGWFDTQQ